MFVISDISKEEVVEHDQWYKKYMNLKSKYKSVINEWRAKQKQQSQQNRNSSLINAERKTKSKTIKKQSESEKEKIKEWKVRSRILCSILCDITHLANFSKHVCISLSFFHCFIIKSCMLVL